MLYPDDAITQAVHRWGADYRAGKIPAEKFWRKLLDLDPNDALALIEMAKLRFKAGDMAAAQDLLWRAIELQPLLWHGYLILAETYDGNPDQTCLAWALRGLAIQKLSRTPEDGAGLGLESVLPDSDAAQLFKELPPDEQLQVIAAACRERAANEPAEVTLRLRHCRLLEQLHDNCTEVSAELVDQIVGEGPGIVPWLVGVLRGWAQNALPEDDEVVVEDALALLGEIGEPSAIPALCEFLDGPSDDLHGAADWAFDKVLRSRPAESVPILARAAPDFPQNVRPFVALKLALHPQLQGVETVFERLATQLDRVPKEERTGFFHNLLLATVAAPCGSYELGRRLLRRASSALSRAGRLECEELLEDLDFASKPPLDHIPPSKWTVYDICAGNAAWERLDHEQEEQEDQDEFATLRARLADFIPQVLGENETRKAVLDFGTEGDKKDIAPFVDWVIHDRILPRSGRTLIEEYIHRHAATLTPHEHDILNAWAVSYVGLYEIQQITAGTGVEMKSLLDGDVLFVHDIAASNQLSKWDALLARVVLGPRGNELSGLANVVPRRQVEALRTWMVKGRKAAGSSWPRYLKQNWPAIRRKMFDNSDEWASSLRLQNTDGEELLISTAVYRVIDLPAVTAVLEARPDMVHESDEHYTWLKGSKEDTGITILGKLMLRPAELTVECNSKERLERAKSMLAESAGPALEHLRDTFTTQSELKRQMRDTPETHSPSDTGIPPEEANRIIAEYQERHYAQWPDTKLPALRGKTPREAVKTPAGRRQVEALLRDFENGEARNRKAGGPSYDFSRIRTALDL